MMALSNPQYHSAEMFERFQLYPYDAKGSHSFGQVFMFFVDFYCLNTKIGGLQDNEIAMFISLLFHCYRCVLSELAYVHGTEVVGV